MAINEEIAERKIYRVLVDESTKKWSRCYLLTNGNSVDFEDGMTAEQKIGAMKGIATEKKTVAGFVMDASVAELAPVELTGTLIAGQTSKSWTDPSITSTSIISVFTNVDGVIPSAKTQVGNTFTATFPAQQVNVDIIVHVAAR